MHEKPLPPRVGIFSQKHKKLNNCKFYRSYFRHSLFLLTLQAELLRSFLDKSGKRRSRKDQEIKIKEQGWRSGESTRLPPSWPGFESWRDAICGLSLLLVLSLAPGGFSPGTPVFPSP